MANTIRIKRRASGNAGAPSSLQNAELAYNEVDDILYYGKGTGGAGGTATTIPAIGGPGADQLAISTGGTHRLTVDASGDVGIGTVSPTGRLQISAVSSGPETNEFGVNFFLGSVSPTANRYIKITQAFTGASFDGFPIVWETNANGSNQKAYGYIQTFADGSISLGNKAAGSSVAVGTALGATERLRITIGGNVQPGADNSQSLGVSGIRWSAVWAANGTIQTSDEREKTDITPSTLGIDFIKSLNPVSYKWKVGHNQISTDEDGNQIITPIPGNRTHWGLLAQEVKETADNFGVDFGGWILTDTEDPDSEQGLRYDQFIAPLIKAIQEQQSIIDSLKSRIEVLEGKN